MACIQGHAERREEKTSDIIWLFPRAFLTSPLWHSFQSTLPGPQTLFWCVDSGMLHTPGWNCSGANLPVTSRGHLFGFIWGHMQNALGRLGKPYVCQASNSTWHVQGKHPVHCLIVPAIQGPRYLIGIWGWVYYFVSPLSLGLQVVQQTFQETLDRVCSKAQQGT